ncbi:MAG: tellurite resistance TerB family protein [Sulfurovum sp.]|nr:tellurite resistance TerB family protein [Sulfurovum sp.]
MDAIKILGSLLNSGALSKGSGGDVLGTLIGAALGGSQNEPTQGGGSLGDLLGSVLDGGASSSSTGGLGDLLGGLLGGGKSSSGGGIGDLLGSVLGGGTTSNAATPTDAKGLEDLLGIGKSASGGLGGLLGGALAKYGQVQNPNLPTPSADDYSTLPKGMNPREASKEAELMIKAMINAAKSDGNFDEAEQKKILSKLGDVTQDEINFIRREFATPLDVQEFVNSVPRGLERQVYLISLAAIDLDENSEAKYLGELAKELRIDTDEANQIHAQLGAPKIFS